MTAAPVDRLSAIVHINRALAAQRQPAFLWRPVKGAAPARPKGGDGVNKRLLVFIVIGLGLLGLVLYVGFSGDLHRIFQRPGLGHEYQAGLPLGRLF
jgi:hypothetical protein